MTLWRRVALVACFLTGSALGAGLTDPSFERGGKAPEGWQLQGTGKWEETGRTGQRSASVTGTGADSSYWRTIEPLLEPGRLYRVSFWAKADRAAAGCVISGPSFCNRDFRAGGDWQRHSFVFVTPPELPEDAHLRFGQWHVPTRVLFDDVALQPTQAVHQRFGDIVLGEGEQVSGRTYTFQAPLGAEGANHSRPLQSFRCGFNSNRWVFYDGAQVVYRHAAAGRKQTAASVEITSQYYQSGTCFIDVSADGEAWQTVGRLEAATTARAEMPAALLPAEAVFVRLRASGRESDSRDSKPGDLQIHAYRYTATLDADLGSLYGATAYPDVQVAAPEFPVRLLSLPAAEGEATCRVEVTNRSGERAKLHVAATVKAENGEKTRSGVDADVPPRGIATATLPCELRRAGDNTITIAVTRGREEVYRASLVRHVAMLRDASYGHLLSGDEPCALWWCEGTYKVSRGRALPAARRRVVELAAARNEYEPVQLVLRPTRELQRVRVSVTPLIGRAGAIGTEHVRVDRVAYVEVVRPTDRAGVRGWWPDPLPPFEQGCTLEAGRNHPLWITVYVPPGQPAGEYRGAVRLAAEGWAAEVPLQLRVWDFELPKMATLQTGFGLSVGNIRRYHNLETADELRQVLDLYQQSFAAHRIAPYDPAPLDPIQVDFSTGPWEGGSFDTTDPKEGKRCLKVVDDKPGASIASHNSKLIPVDTTKTYHFSWWVKTEKPDQQYLVTLQQYDAAQQWISGNNMDFPRTGSGKWEHGEVTIPAPGGRPFNPKTKFLGVALRPAPYSDAGEALGTAWFDGIRLSLGDGPNLVEDGGFEQAERELEAKVDFAAWDKAAERTLGELGFNSFRYCLRGMGGGTFHSRRAGRIGGYVQGTPEYEALMASQGRQVVEHFKAKGWLERAYMYWFDEPDKKDYEFVAEGMELIKRAAPGLTRMLTEQPEEGLIGHVDLWCPVVSNIGPQTIAERRKAGERFWWYLCCGPRAPYIGLFIDHPAVDLRVWAWLSRKWGVEGQLVWTSNYWTSTAAFPPPDIQNPWADPMSYVSGYSYKPGQIGYWGNGDGRFLYPPSRDVKNDKRRYLCGPVPSLRWEMIREGLEDYEYFVLLDRLIAQARERGRASRLLAEAARLTRVPDAVIADDKTYSKDPQALHAHRRKVAELVERLSRALR